MTGESMPVPKREAAMSTQGRVAEEGECVVCVEKALGGGRMTTIVRMIEESEKLKSTAEDKASRLADKLYPIRSVARSSPTRSRQRHKNVVRADGRLLLPLKLSMPIAVLSVDAREQAAITSPSRAGASSKPSPRRTPSSLTRPDAHLRHAQGPRIVTFGGYEESEMLRLAACLEDALSPFHRQRRRGRGQGPRIHARGVSLSMSVRRGARHFEHGGRENSAHRQRTLRLRGRGMPCAGG